MGRLFGRALVRETYDGIADLVVFAFDQDRAARGDAAGTDHQGEHQGVDGARLRMTTGKTARLGCSQTA